MTFLDQPPQGKEQAPAPAAGVGAAEIVSALLLAAAAFGIAAVAAVRDLIARAQDGVLSYPVESSCVSVLEYSTRDGTMTVTFTDGTVYDYPNIRPDDFMRFLAAPSKGSFFNAEVRGRW